MEVNGPTGSVLSTVSRLTVQEGAVLSDARFSNATGFHQGEGSLLFDRCVRILPELETIVGEVANELGRHNPFGIEHGFVTLNPSPIRAGEPVLAAALHSNAFAASSCRLAIARCFMAGSPA